jgi:hypothetical protein
VLEPPPDDIPPLTLAVPPSALVVELRGFPARTLRMMGITPEALEVFDAIMEGAKVLVDDTDRRPVTEKLEAVFEAVNPKAGEAFAQRLTEFDEDAVREAIRFYSRQDYRRYLRRMLGEGGLHRLLEAASVDLDILITLVYRAVDVVTPYAVAIEELAGALDERQVKRFMDVYPAGGFLLRLMLQICDSLDLMVEKVMVPELMEVLAAERSRRPLTRDVEQLTRDARVRMSGLSRELVKDLSATLDRKLRGAKDALAFSADSTSQAANSLIEFIDRLLRNAFSEAEVMAWVEVNYAGVPDLLYEDDRGKVRPTKRAQALCLSHGGQPVAQHSPFHLLAATALNAARRELQSIKHADEGTDDERRRVESCTVVVEAFVQFGCRLAWVALPNEALQELRGRLDPSSRDQADAVAGGVA